MPNLGDHRFEIYLKGFRPLPPEPLPLSVSADAPEKGKRHAAIPVGALAVAAVAILAFVVVRGRTRRVIPANGSRSPSAAAQLQASQPLTLATANQLLVNSPSFEAALDSLESESGAVAIPRGRESALAVLSEENLKP